MQNLVNDSPTKKNFAFVDSIRAIAMMSIVYEHSSLFWGQNYPSFADSFLQTFFVVGGKFGTIIFFLLSGFLMNYKFGEYSAYAYIKNRFKSTFGPWLLWVFILLLVTFLHKFVVYLRFGVSDFHSFGAWMAFIGKSLNFIVFYTNYWFILNFLICICIILAFKRNIYSYKLGAFLGALSLFYSINLYCRWIPTEHTTAIFGFVFYLWVGIMINKNFAKLQQWLDKTGLGFLWALTIVTLLIDCTESMWLIKLHSDDPFNTLKITNILFSFSMFLLLLKYGEMPKVNSLKPRETTYGIYLIHQIVAIYGLPLIFSPMHLGDTIVAGMAPVYIALFGLLRFIIVYSVTYLLARLLAFSKIKWTIGR